MSGPTAVGADAAVPHGHAASMNSPPPARNSPGPLGEAVPSPAERRFLACVAEVLRHEGGYVDHPEDPGGCTNRGITRLTLERWRREPVTCDDVRALGEPEARAIYRAHYWNAVRADQLPAGVDLCVFDAAVNSGRRRAAEWLQQALRLNQVDGAIGPVTLAAAADAARHGAGPLIADLCGRRLGFLRTLGTWRAFGRGWTQRVEAVRREATKAAAVALAEAESRRNKGGPGR